MAGHGLHARDARSPVSIPDDVGADEGIHPCRPDKVFMLAAGSIALSVTSCQSRAAQDRT